MNFQRMSKKIIQEDLSVATRRVTTENSCRLDFAQMRKAIGFN